ncbi:MAG: hypothetical protein WC522_00295 [Candidatus Omnitrophota bacterium]
MATLIIFDSSVCGKEASAVKLPGKTDEAVLFPLTSDSGITSEFFNMVTAAGFKARLLDTAGLINSAAEELRGRYLKFIADMPDNVIAGNKNIKEMFALDGDTSLWWLSLVAGKSNFKSIAFNSIAQLDAMIKAIGDNGIDNAVYAGRDHTLRKSFLEYCREKRILVKCLPGAGFKDILDGALQWKPVVYLGHIYFLFRAAAGFLVRMSRARNMASRAGGPGRVKPGFEHPMLITYYPVIDTALAGQGIFKNIHYDYIQEALESKGQKPVWVALYLKNPAVSHAEAVKYAEKFIKNGYSIYMLDEFGSVRSHLAAFLRIISFGMKFLFYERSIAKLHDLGGYNVYDFLKNDWYSSFCGSAGYSAILYYEMFKSMFAASQYKKCFFQCEMQPWEKALISARNFLGSSSCLVGYQAGVPARMLLGCFNHPAEFRRDCRYPMPVPDKYVCNGNVTFNNLKECGWPEDTLGIVEAVRYNYLKRYLESRWDKKRKVVLLLFSISVHESSAILNTAYHALKGLDGVEVWMRPHPFISIESVLKQSGRGINDIPFVIKDGPLADSLREARIVIGGESGTCVEALAFGCNVVLVNNPEWINMSSLKHEKSGNIKTAGSAEELKSIVTGILAQAYDPGVLKKESARIIGNYYYLDPASDTPSRILELLTPFEAKKG